MTDKTPELKNCPCCRGNARLHETFKNKEPGTDHFGRTKTGERITCTICGLTIKKAKNVVLAWNTRPHQEAPKDTLEWQPIETAPSKALIFVPGTGTGMIYVGWKGANGKWIVFDTGQGESASVFPTHWMPLPAPPKALQKAGV